MKASEANYRAAQKYRKDKCRRITLELSKSVDEKMLAWLDSQENKQGYIKQLIREDMARQGFKKGEE